MTDLTRSREMDNIGGTEMKEIICANPSCDERFGVPSDYEYEYCCNGIECGCYGYPINPMFCDACEIKMGRID